MKLILATLLSATLLGITARAGAHGDASPFAESEADAVRSAEDIGHQVTTHDYFRAEIRVDPRRLVAVPIKINARVASLARIYPGKRVVKGEILGELESAELETIQRTYAALVANIDAVQAASVTSNERLISARIDLEWRGMSPDEIRQLEATGQPLTRVAVRAPESGYLYSIDVVANQIVGAGQGAGQTGTPATVFATIARRDAISVESAVPAAVAARLHPGAPARVVVYRGGAAPQVLEGVVQEVFGFITASNQRQRVRISLRRSAGYLPPSGLTTLASFP